MAVEPKADALFSLNADSNSFPLEELEPAPEIYVDGFQGLVMASGVAKITFFSIYHDPLSGKNKRRVVLHMACPVGTMDGIRVAFESIVNELKTQGFILPAPPHG